MRIRNRIRNKSLELNLLRIIIKNCLVKAKLFRNK